MYTVILALGRQKPADSSQFEASLVYTGRHFVKQIGVCGGSRERVRRGKEGRRGRERRKRSEGKWRGKID